MHNMINNLNVNFFSFILLWMFACKYVCLPVQKNTYYVMSSWGQISVTQLYQHVH